MLAINFAEFFVNQRLCGNYKSLTRQLLWYIMDFLNLINSEDAERFQQFQGIVLILSYIIHSVALYGYSVVRVFCNLVCGDRKYKKQEENAPFSITPLLPLA